MKVRIAKAGPVTAAMSGDAINGGEAIGFEQCWVLQKMSLWEVL